jgi:hypothetical protein
MATVVPTSGKWSITTAASTAINVLVPA